MKLSAEERKKLEKSKRGIKMKVNKSHWIGLVFGLVIVVVDLIFFLGDNIFWFLVGVSVVVIVLPFVGSLISEGKVERDKNEKFLEFTRNLAESVKTGTPIGQSILNMRNKDFGSLTKHVQKLANQISMGIPIGRAFQTFAGDLNSTTIRRAVTLIREAESAGGQIDTILNSVANSIYQIEKLRKERKAAIYNLVVQGYIIFFIFIGIMLVMQFKIIPLTADVGNIGSIDGGLDDAGSGGLAATPEALARPFLYL